MGNLEQINEALLQSWGAKTLDTLRAQAKATASGVAFDAIRDSGGKRLILALGATNKHAIAAIRKSFALTGGGLPEDWTKLTLLELAIRAGTGQDFTSKALKNSVGDVAAVVLVAAEPASIATLERVFQLPK